MLNASNEETEADGERHGGKNPDCQIPVEERQFRRDSAHLLHARLANLGVPATAVVGQETDQAVYSAHLGMTANETAFLYRTCLLYTSRCV